MARKSWDAYFMDIAKVVASRATCPRLHVGAVLVQGKRIRGTGYNGAPAGLPSCEDEGCLLTETYEEEHGAIVKKEHCIRTIHAEINLLSYTDVAERQGATVYLTDEPCYTCAKALANSGIAEVVYERPYLKDHARTSETLAAKGIVLRRLTAEGSPVIEAAKEGESA